MRIATISIVSCLVFAALPAFADPTKTETGDVAVKGALERQAALVDLSHAAEASNPNLGLKSAGDGSVAPSRAPSVNTNDVNAHAKQGAGSARAVGVGGPATKGVERPAAGPRVLQRMDAGRVLNALGPAMRACANQGVGAAPAATLALKFSVLPSGDVEHVDVSDRGGARDEVVSCIVGVAQTAKFHAPSGAGASMVLPILVPAKSASPAAAAAPASTPASDAPPAS